MKKEIMFEVLPYTKTASDKAKEKATNKIVEAIIKLKSVDIINIPEIVEENHIGAPYYRNVDIRKFGTLLRNRCNKDIMVNTVVVHYRPKEKFEHWLDESIKNYGIKNFVFVGAKVDGLKYPGPNVKEANLIAKNKGINFGNIFIPNRESEADRLIEKTASGCKFFSSQVLFDSRKVSDVLNEYSLKCAEKKLKPAKFYLSFSPVSNFEDISFIEWLGSEIKEDVKNRLRRADNIGEESVNIALELIQDIFSNADKMRVKVPISLNIEYIMLHNLELAKDLVHHIENMKLDD